MIAEVGEQLAVLDQAGLEPDAVVVSERRCAHSLVPFRVAHGSISYDSTDALGCG